MKIIDICNMLRNELFDNKYEYGFYLDGKKYKPDTTNGFDEHYYQLSMTLYTVQSPEETSKAKIGTCIDAVVLMKALLDKHSIPNTIWLLLNKTKHKAHTVLTFGAEDKTVYLELTPSFGKPWYGKEIIYTSVQDFVKEYEKQDFEVIDVTKEIVIGKQPIFLLERI